MFIPETKLTAGMNEFDRITFCKEIHDGCIGGSSEATRYELFKYHEV